MSLRVGILGAARVATYALIDAARDVDGVEVAAVAARNPERARAYAGTHGIARALPDYRTLVEDDGLDAVYVALPPALHARWSIAAVEAGKPVLCEKPFALALADVDAMLDAEARTGRLIMEAQHSWYHPINVRAREVMASGAIGMPLSAAAHFSAPVEQVPGELRWDGAMGGGALWDLGVYPACWLAMLAGPLDVAGASHALVEGGADAWTRAELALAGGGRANLFASMVDPLEAWVEVTGERGTLRVDNPLSARLPQALTLTIDGGQTVEHFTRRASYAFQLEAFRDAVASGQAPPTRGSWSRQGIALLAAIRDAAQQER